METTPARHTAEFWIHLVVQLAIWGSQLVDVSTGAHTNPTLAAVLSVAVAAAHMLARGIGRAASSPGPGTDPAALMGQIDQAIGHLTGSKVPPGAGSGPPPRSGGSVTGRVGQAVEFPPEPERVPPPPPPPVTQ
jgi:hypothetical protein